MLKKLLAVLVLAPCAIFMFAVPSLTVGYGSEDKEFWCYGVGAMLVVGMLAIIFKKR